MTSLVKALCFGGAFGFLLQKGGVADFHILIGALLLEDFVVMKVMLSAVAVGMIGVAILRRFGWVELSIEPLQPTRNIVGGIIFGVGFAFSGYCPGTGAAAVGQLNGDAIFMMLGMLAGSYGFAFVSGKAQRWGQSHGKARLVVQGRKGELVSVLAIATLIITAIAMLPS